MIGYKGFDKNLQCKGLQYHIDKEMVHNNSIEVTVQGLHFCRVPISVFRFYNSSTDLYAIVEALGDIKHNDDQDISVTNKLRIVKLISAKEMIEICNFGKFIFDDFVRCFHNDLLHRDDGPAFVTSYAKIWYRHGVIHREDGPAKEYSNGDKYWLQNGKLHRVDGPAIEWKTMNEWFLNGKLHRDDGPAVTYANGTQYWFLNGLLHREDGPAVLYDDGSKEWWVNGKKSNN